MTGFDRMLVDKINWFKVTGWMFAMMGVANVASYAASLMMRPDNFKYHFAYDG